MGKWLEWDLRIDKYAWEIDLDGYYLSQIKINISIAPLHPSVSYRWLPDLFYLFCFAGWKKHFTCIHTHAKESESIRYPRDRCYRALSHAFTLPPACSAPHHSLLPTWCRHPWSPTGREVPRPCDTHFEKMGSTYAAVFYPGLSPLAAPSLAVTVKPK